MIPENLKIISILFIIFLVFIITLFVRKHRITIKYSLIWYLCLLIILLFVFFPSILVWIADIFKIQVVSNLFFALIIAFLLVILMSLTIIVSKQKEQIKMLIQEVSILKKREKNEKE